MFKIFFGGSFDPVHVGHLIVARDVFEDLKVEKIIFVPAFQSPLKEPHRATPKQRLVMLHMATKGEGCFDVSDIEIRRGGISYTVDTAQELLSHLGERPTFLVGADSILTLHMWKDPQRLTQIARFVIADRNKKAQEVKKYFKLNFPSLREERDFFILETRNIDVSSTEIRQRLKEGKSIKWLVPEDVQEYILEKGIYIREPPPA
ncbi:nicotinate (nicotinamide) nucleotide adenylyltransferase [Hydrogenobacter thermophilus]|uniref:nicotinate (nicotinamide) nucleotide adenylyltransferase n=1 Tax=Hydrogenobacter thermophilus TaxID=940 RepID=UPI0030F899AE